MGTGHSAREGRVTAEVLVDDCRCADGESHLVRYALESGAVLIGEPCTAHPRFFQDIRSKDGQRWGHRAVRVTDNKEVICSNGLVFGLPKETAK